MCRLTLYLIYLYDAVVGNVILSTHLIVISGINKHILYHSRKHTWSEERKERKGFRNSDLATSMSYKVKKTREICKDNYFRYIYIYIYVNILKFF